MKNHVAPIETVRTLQEVRFPDQVDQIVMIQRTDYGPEQCLTRLDDLRWGKMSNTLEEQVIGPGFVSSKHAGSLSINHRCLWSRPLSRTNVETQSDKASLVIVSKSNISNSHGFVRARHVARVDADQDFRKVASRRGKFESECLLL
jgi:hypothetical protein